MRIGFFTDGFLPQPNGVATSVYESAKELKRRGHEVIIVAPKYPGFIDKDIEVIRLASVKVLRRPETRIAPSFPDRALRKVLSLDFDIIHGHSGGPVTLLGWEISRRKNIPFVVTYHTLWNRYTHYFLKGKIVSAKMLERATKIFGNRIDHLVAPTKRVLEELRSYGVKRPITVIPSGIDIEKYQVPSKGALRDKAQIKSDPILLFVGRLGREKSVDFIIKSFKLVLEKKSNAQLVIIGDGPDKRKLESLSKKIGVSKNVHFLGEFSNSLMPALYKDADVFVFASSTETQGLVVPEALASGVPVVAVDDPALECIKNGVNGFLTPRNKRDFALKILSILENKNLRETLSQNARRMSEDLSVKKTVDAFESIYYELLDRYNKESILRVMRQNERGEQFYVAYLSFWLTIFLARFFSLISFSSEYPKIIIGSSLLYHSQVAAAVLLFALAGFIRRRKMDGGTVALIGIGVGLIADELWSIIFQHQFISDYWSPLNFLLIVLLGFAFYILLQIKNKKPHEFYIGLREQKHENPDAPKITVVLPAYNEEAFIDATLKSLVNQTYKNFELIVVDNNSTDKTSQVAQKYGARVVFEKQKGVAFARQAGFFEARGEIIACTDADAIVPENWLERIIAEFERDKSIIAFGGLSYLYSGPISARAAARYLFPAFWVADRILSGGWNLAGFNMAVRRDAFFKIGGFNTSLTLGEDVDLAKRLRKIGRVLVDTNFTVFVSGRRYRNGLFSGIATYAPSWIARVFFHKDKFLNLPTVRTEKTSNNISHVPIVLATGILFLFFFLANYRG